MTLKWADRVLETTTTTGTGTITLGGAQTGHQAFASRLAEGDICYYGITDAIGPNWEIGRGTFHVAGPTLTRDTVLQSSNADARVPFSAGTKNVFLDLPSSVATLSSRTVVNVLDYGADPTGATYSDAAFAAAIATIESFDPVEFTGGRLYVPVGIYKLSQTLLLRRGYVVEGACGSGWFAGTQLHFDAGVGGFLIQGFYDTPGHQRGDWTVIRDMAIIGNHGATAHGVQMNARTKLENLWIRGFSGDGVFINSVDPLELKNANGWQINFCRIDQCDGNGIHTEGGNSQAGVGSCTDIANCNGYGVLDNAGLNNTWVGLEVAECVGGSYGGGASSTFVGCYAEADTPAVNLTSPTSIWLGGNPGPGFDNSLALRRLVPDVNGLGVYPSLTHNHQDGHGVTLHAAFGSNDTAASQFLFGTSEDSLTEYTLWYHYSVPGTWQFMYNQSVRILELTNAAAAVGGGKLIFPTGFYLGDPSTSVFQQNTGTAAPTSGAHNRGDVVWNHGITSSADPFAFACVTSGTPGTWVSLMNSAVVPNTLPTAGQILVGNAGGTAYAPQTLSGAATLASTGALTLANSGVGAGTYSSVTVNTKGLVTAGTNVTLQLINTQTFSSPGTFSGGSGWQKPAGAVLVIADVWGAGGKGGGGEGRAVANARCGGGGGGGGAHARLTFDASTLLAQETVVVGAGGTSSGGGGSNAPGVSGVAGGNSRFGEHLYAFGGGGGTGGTNASASAGGGGGGVMGAGGSGGSNNNGGAPNGTSNSGMGGGGAGGPNAAVGNPAEWGGASGGGCNAGGTTTAAGAISQYGGSGGGAGGGVNNGSPGTAINGAAGGGAFSSGSGTSAGGGSAGTAGGTGGTGSGGSGNDAASGGQGGGGGGSSNSTTGGAGGPGGAPGGGGGGGGGGTSTGGAGGNGADGKVVIRSYAVV